MSRTIDMTGQRFGMLTVLSRSSGAAKRGLYWLCRCDCGVEKSIQGGHIRRGTVSCGCFVRNSSSRHRTHGMTKTSTYKSWRSMRERVLNPAHGAYESYGGRGITIDPRWDSFEAFLEDMGQRPAGTSLDRKNGLAGYSKENCRWANAFQQSRNRVGVMSPLAAVLSKGMRVRGASFTDIAHAFGVNWATARRVTTGPSHMDDLAISTETAIRLVSKEEP